MLTDEQMHDRMKNGWRGGLPYGTVCGIGSTLENTANARAWLPSVCHDYGIASVNDAGAGDLTWIRKVDWRGIEVRYFDLIPRSREVLQLDITKQTMPRADAILCRHCLNHLDEIRVGMAIERFRECASFLIATQFDRPEPGDHREFTRLDLRLWLGDSLTSIEDGGAQHCRLAIWKL